ncbi:AAA family ATPase [Corallococcus llansteffanensis]|uniref:AAA family ATPase n=1 Tax=Corallococcus llansteffanensis TaxID=2316731 RepID=UPI0013151369|nr:adenylate/guanylate cyclase domain-containing protein [Corallococcus llansteffanensis]
MRGLADDETRPREGARSSGPAVILLADITGFTPLTETLERSGPEGAERLSGIINTCFSTLLETVLDHGGDILRFAGDAILALWPAEDLSHSARMAAQCAQAIQTTVEQLEVEGLQLKLRIGISAGTVVLSDVGGENGRWEFLASGPVLLEMARAEHEAQPGDVVLCAETARCLRGVAEGEVLPSGRLRLKALAPLPLPRVRLPEPFPRMEPGLRSYLPEVVLRRLDAGHAQWLAEFRNVTILFIGLTEPSLSAGEHPEALQRAYRTIQEGLQRYEGCSTQLVVDDKGVVTVAAFGMPPLSHEDDAVRACRSALRIHAALSQQGLSPCVGLTSGRILFCTYGTAFRREYMMVGRAVNLAARLMQAARGTVLCDAATARLASGPLAFDALPSILVKGREAPVEIFRPVVVSASHRPSTRQTTLVGRREERGQLSAAVNALASRGEGGLVWIEGEAGMGKSRLVQYLRETAAGVGVEAGVGEANALEITTPLHCWREPLVRILGLKELPDEATRTARLLCLLEGRPEAREMASLLNGLLGVHVPEHEQLRGLSGQLHASNTRELLVGLLADACQARLHVVVLDDVHWMDSSSWELVAAVRARSQRVLMVLAGRPMESLPAEARRLRESPGTTLLQLERLHALDAISLVCERLGVRTLSPPIAEFIRVKAEGNPFFSGELASSLVEHGYLVVIEGVAHLASGVDLGQLDLPHSVQGVVSSRIDRLTPTQQLVLKTASIIGRVFPLELLQELYPVDADRTLLGDALETLSQARMVTRQTSEARTTYAFAHALIHDAAYERMVFSQRRRLHRDMAVLLERLPAPRRDVAFHARLAHHWKSAGELSKAVDSLDQAGTGALATGAFREAHAFLADARSASAQLRIDNLRRARWSTGIGEALHSVGEISRSHEALEEAFGYLGYRLPQSRLGWMTRSLWEVGRQLAHLAVPRALTPVAGEDERLVLEARALALAGRLFFFNRDYSRLLTCSLIAINNAEAARQPTGAAMAYLQLGFAVGTARLAKLARRYIGLSRSVSDPGLRALSLVAESSLLGFGASHRQSISLAEQAVERMRQLNDLHGAGHALVTLIHALLPCGDARRILPHREALLTLGQQNANAQQIGWAHIYGAVALLTLARPAEVIAGLREVEPLIPRFEKEDPHTVLGIHSAAALALTRLGKMEAAQDEAERGLKVLHTYSPLLPLEAPLLIGLVEACQALWEDAQTRNPTTAGTWRAHAKTARRALRLLVRLHPFWQASDERLDGVHHALSGERARALRLFARAKDSARRYGLELEEGLALQELGRWTLDPHQRRDCLIEAREIFMRLEATHPLQATQALAPELFAEAPATAVG